MNTDSSLLARREPSLAKKIFIVLSVLLVFFAAYRLILFALFWSSIAAIHQAGLPVSLEEVIASLPSVPPPGENAAEFYVKAAEQNISMNVEVAAFPLFCDRGSLPPRNRPLPPEVKRGSAQYLAANEKCMRLLKHANAIKQCWIGEKDYREHRLGHRMCYSLSPTLRLEALLAMEDANYDLAVDDIAGAFAIGDALYEEPFINAFDARLAIWRIACSDVERILNHTSLTSSQLQRLIRAMPKALDEQDVHRVLVQERTVALIEMANLDKGMLRYVASEFASAVAAVRASASAENINNALRQFLRMSIAWLYEAGSAQCHRSQFNVLKQYENVLEPCPSAENMDRLKSLSYRGQWSCGGATQWRGLHARFDNMQRMALARITRTALAVEQFRNDKNRLPENLTELSPAYSEVLPDPYDNKPLRYRKLWPPQRGYVVYSIGEDCKDDGGTGNSKSEVSFKPDITFTVER